MTQLEKLLGKFLERPTSLRYSEIQKVLSTLGFTKIKVKRGSHEKFKHRLLRHDLIFPVHNGDCAPFYKIHAARVIIENELHN